MKQTIFITGTGREQALGYSFVRHYLEEGHQVMATIRKPSKALELLQQEYPASLRIFTIDIGDSASVNRVAQEVAEITDHIDLIINNAVIVSPDCNKAFSETNLDYIAHVIDVDSVGPLRVIQSMLPLLKKSDQTALIVNISSEAGSISKCYRTDMLDYAMAKAALNMGTMTLRNVFKNEPDINIICIHPGWMRTNEGNSAAPLDPYENAKKMSVLFEEKRNIKDGEVFFDYEGNVYPW